MNSQSQSNPKMLKKPVIHVFLGAPSIPNPLEGSEQSRRKRKNVCSSSPAAEKWRELHCSCEPGGISSGNTKDVGPLVLENSAVPATGSSQQGRVVAAREYLVSAVPGAVTGPSAGEKAASFKSSDCQLSPAGCMSANLTQQLLQQCRGAARPGEQTRGCCSEPSERTAQSSELSALVASTEQISLHLRAQGQGVQSAGGRHHCEHFSQDLGRFFSSKQESNPRGWSELAVSADTEFRSIVTQSQVAVLTKKERKIELLGKRGEKLEERHCDHFQLDSGLGMWLDGAEKEDPGSLELFSSEDDEQSVCSEAPEQQVCAQEEREKSQELHVAAEQSGNEVQVEALSSGILCSQGDSWQKNSAKRPLKSEDPLPLFHSPLKRQLESKRPKLNSSPAGPGMKTDQERVTNFQKLPKKLSALKSCCCKNQKYNVLVTIVHPSHVKEIQVKTRPKSSCKVPVATIVVLDQSGAERKVVLWHGAAFWSLTVFPGDVVLLTDIIMYENVWYGEIMLQSTLTSQLLNLGNCSALKPEEFYPVVDGGVLHGLLAYISAALPHLREMPQRQVQRLESVQHVQLDQLQPNALVHALLRITSIAILTESVYSYRGGYQRKIILTVEQNRDQPYRMVLWGAGAAWCPQLQRKKDHIWDFKYLLVQCSCVSGDLELHTTPWSSCECLFDDDNRALEFKEKFQKSQTPTMKVTKLSAHLEEKISGVFQVKGHISELKFPIPSGEYKQLLLCADTSRECVLASLPLITYSGCAKCGLELQADENMIYKQCLGCLPHRQVKKFYRPALMTVEDGGYEIHVHVVSELMEKIFLNIPADWLNRVVVPSSDITYSWVVADLCHLLLADREASYLMEIRSHFVLDENSYPLEKDFHLLSLHPQL